MQTFNALTRQYNFTLKNIFTTFKIRRFQNIYFYNFNSFYQLQ